MKAKIVTKPKGKHKPKPGQGALEDKLCLAIASSTLGLKDICAKDPEFPSPATIFNWLGDPTRKEFLEKYTRAKQLQAEHMAEEILQIADDSSEDQMFNKYGDAVENKEFVNRSRLRIDARKWLMSKILPKKYGDKVEVSGDKENPISHVITGMVVK